MFLRTAEEKENKMDSVVIRHAVEHLMVNLPIMHPNQLMFSLLAEGCNIHSISGYSPGENKTLSGWGSSCPPAEMAIKDCVSGGIYAESDEDLPALSDNELVRWCYVFVAIHDAIHENKIVRFGVCDAGFTVTIERKLGTGPETSKPTLLEAFEAALWTLE
jgi:hypothetical protein